MASKVRSTLDAVRRIKAHKPETREDFEKLGVNLQTGPFNAGSFREVFMPKDKKIKIVVKFPMGKSGRIHSNDEIRKLVKLRKFDLLKPHLPQVYYHSYKTGVIVMKRYSEFKWKREEDYLSRIGELTGKLIERLTGVEMDDIQETNVRSDGGKGFIFIDLGY